MKRILFIVFTFFLPFFSIASSIKATQDSTIFSDNKFENANANFICSFDTSLKKLEIYDPASLMNHFGLGFPGASTRTLYYSEKNTIGVSPIFNSFTPLLYTTELETNFNLKKPVTQIKYVIFPSLKTEQFLDLFHTRNLTKNINTGIQFRKIKSNGYFLKQGSNISNLLTYIDLNSKNSRYHLYSNFVYNGLVSIENGGLQNDSIDYSSKSISLQNLPVNLEEAKNRVALWGGRISQSFDFGKTVEIAIDSLESISEFTPSSRLALSLDYSNHATTYIDNYPTSEFYDTIYKDSIDTFDKFNTSSFVSEFSYSLVEKTKNNHQSPLLSSIGVTNEISFLVSSESEKSFSNTSVFASVYSPKKMVYRYGVNGSYFIDGYNKENVDVNALIGRKFLDSTKYEFIADLFASYQKSTPAYRFQNYYSNHFKWENQFKKQETTKLGIRFLSSHLFNLKLSYVELAHFVFMDSLSLPTQLSSKMNYFSGNFDKLFKIGSFYLNANLVYQKVLSERDVLGFPEFYTRNSLYWANSIFKKALDLQIGFDIIYTSKYFGLAYQPALNTFYFQNKKQVGGYAAIDFFINFKIRQARLFLKVDHLNYGLAQGNYEYVPDYLLPGRTYRFGLSWLFLN